MFNFWPFNINRKRREGDLLPPPTRPAPPMPTIKKNKVIPLDDPRHPRNLSPQQRADAIARQREEYAERKAREAECREREGAAFQQRLSNVRAACNSLSPTGRVPTMPRAMSMPYGRTVVSDPLPNLDLTDLELRVAASLIAASNGECRVETIQNPDSVTYVVSCSAPDTDSSSTSDCGGSNGD